MIRIHKPQAPPFILTAAGAKKSAALRRAYQLHPQDYQQGIRAFNFDAGIYAHPEVKQALLHAQHRKCCFCERRTGLDGDVEHFRPKAGCRQATGDPLLVPGYYWLVYDWANLFLCCSACNQRFKRNLFPLRNPGARARSHHDPMQRERPLLIHPAEEDPEQFISFHKEIPYAVRDSKRGKATIQAIGLDREILNEERRDHLSVLILMREMLDLSRELSRTAEGRRQLDRARAYLDGSTQDSAEFAGMARAAKRQGFRTTLP